MGEHSDSAGWPRGLTKGSLPALICSHCGKNICHDRHLWTALGQDVCHCRHSYRTHSCRELELCLLNSPSSPSALSDPDKCPECEWPLWAQGRGGRAFLSASSEFSLGITCGNESALCECLCYRGSEEGSPGSLPHSIEPRRLGTKRGPCHNATQLKSGTLRHSWGSVKAVPSLLSTEGVYIG